MSRALSDVAAHTSGHDTTFSDLHRPRPQAQVQLVLERPAVRRLSRQRVGSPRHRRQPPLRKALPRGLPGRVVMVDHSEEARGVSRSIRRLRSPHRCPLHDERRPATDAQRRNRAALSKELSRLGFRFVGPTTMYAAMQSLGVVNDHYASCAFRSACDSGRSRLARGR